MSLTPAPCITSILIPEINNIIQNSPNATITHLSVETLKMAKLETGLVEIM